MIPGSAHPFFLAGNGYQVQRSARLRAAASAYFSRTPASSSGQSTWTVSFWIKRGQLGTDQNIFQPTNGGDGTNESQMRFTAADKFQIYDSGASAGYMNYVTTQVFRDPNAWYHFVIACDTTQATAANRLKIYVNGTQITSFDTAQTQNQNLGTGWNGAQVHTIGKYPKASSGYADLYLTEFNNVSGQALTPSSFAEQDTATRMWVPKTYTGTYGANGFYLPFDDITDVPSLGYDKAAGSYSANLRNLGTNIGGMTAQGGLAKAFDGANGVQSTEAAVTPTPSDSGYGSRNTVGKDWGAGVTRTITAFRIASPTDDGFRGDQVAIGFKLQGSTDNFSGSVVDLYTGTTPSGINQTVTVTSGITTTTAYRYHRVVLQGNGTSNCRLGEVELFEAGQYGINNWQVNNISLTSGVTYDSMLDVPGLPWVDGGNGRGNYAALSPLVTTVSTTSTITNGNLTHTGANTNGVRASSIAMTTGMFYAECTLTANPSNSDPIIGILNAANTVVNYPGEAADGYGLYCYPANTYLQKVNAGSFANTDTLTSTTGDVIRVAVDLVNNKMWFAKNGTWINSGDPAAGANPSFTIAAGTYYFGSRASGGAGTAVLDWNFGQRPFSYTPPTGFKALNTANMPEPAVVPASQYVAHRYEAGSGIAAAIATDRASWTTWLEVFKRTDASESWKVRFSDDSSNMLAFDSNGAKSAWSAPSTGTYFGLALKLGTGVVSGTYSGDNTANRNISHSLGLAPTCGLVKNESTGSWYLWHTKMTGAAYFTTLNSATPPAQSNTNTPFGTGNWTSTQFMVTNNATNNLNASGSTYRYILFADVSGLLALLGHTGNASADGAFAYVGHEAQLQIEKDLAATTGFYVMSDVINATNPIGSYLLLNTDAGVAAATVADIVSNGVKHRSSTHVNAAAAHASISIARRALKYANGR